MIARGSVGLGFVDLFAGCGGLSLGLVQAGFQGHFASERDAMAFETFRTNFVDGPSRVRFKWPDWLEQRAWAIDDLLGQHEHELKRLRGQIRLVAGGPPCQGFSFAGRRVHDDPRNMLFTKYARFVDAVRPDAVLLENVPGMRVAHGKGSRGNGSAAKAEPRSYYSRLLQILDDLGYVTVGRLLDASQFGVPQRRPRLIVIGLKRGVAKRLNGGSERVFELIESARVKQIKSLGLLQPVTAAQALSDLEVEGRARVPCTDSAGRAGYWEADYRRPRTRYQHLMQEQFGSGGMTSMRLAKHSDTVRRRFADILDHSPRGLRLSEEDRAKFGLLKHRIVPMDPELPAPTLTTLPDDILHYAEPRILTVRESARLQSFPDWFRFCGKYTTGGKARTKECPRYTQVGNAVPPLLARAIGAGIAAALREAQRRDVAAPSYRRERRGILSSSR